MTHLISAIRNYTIWTNPLMHLGEPDTPNNCQTGTLQGRSSVYTLEEVPDFAAGVCTACADPSIHTDALERSWEHINTQAHIPATEQGFEKFMAYLRKLRLASHKLTSLGIDKHPTLPAVDTQANHWIVNQAFAGRQWAAHTGANPLGAVDEQVDVTVTFRTNPRTMSWLYDDSYIPGKPIPPGILLAMSGIEPKRPAGVMPLLHAVEVFNNPKMLLVCTTLTLHPRGRVGRAGQALGLLNYSPGYHIEWQPDRMSEWQKAIAVAA